MVQVRLMRTDPDGNPSLAARELLLSAVKKEYALSDESLRVEQDEKGKPYLAGRPDLHVSISHSGPYVACAFGDKPVGIDLEMWKAHPKWRRIVDKLHPREREELVRVCGGAISPDTVEPVREFCDLWVRKESFLKALGEGLRLPLSVFDTTCEPVGQELREETYFIRNYPMERERLSMAVCVQEEKPPESLPAEWLQGTYL